MHPTPKTIALIILDGWGHRTDLPHNAIAAANTPVWDKLWQDCPHTLLSGSGLDVGLPAEQMGNSEVGHLTMGAGRVIYQELTRIDKAISEGEFFQNPVFLSAINKAKQNNKAVHILGLLSPGGVHSHEQHIQALIKLAAQQHATQVYIHVFLDGRDTPPQSALTSLQNLEQTCQQLKCGKIVSMIGRYYAMDRDKRWERVQAAYELLTEGKAEHHADNAEAALTMAYARGETDEFVKATSIHATNQAPVTINNGDVVIFMNFRADRARELTRAFIDNPFTEFNRHKTPRLADFVSLTQYAADIKTTIAFPPQALTNVIGEYIAQHGLTQLRIAETEKYAHVTFFFNGGQETPFQGEERILVPSPKIATYDLKPEMSAIEMTEQLVKAIHSQKYNLIVCNFANPDMVGHTGNFAATVKAIETVDQCLGRILTALRSINGEMVITADHGNAECMFDEKTQQPHTAHTCELVPFVYYGHHATIIKAQGNLADLAPTILYLMDLTVPAEMTGNSLLKLS